MKVYSVYQEWSDKGVVASRPYCVFADKPQAIACVGELNRQFGKPGTFVYCEQSVLSSWDQKTKPYNFDVHKANNKIKVGLRDVNCRMSNYGLQFWPCPSATERRVINTLYGVAVRARNLVEATKRAQRLVDRYVAKHNKMLQ